MEQIVAVLTFIFLVRVIQVSRRLALLIGVVRMALLVCGGDWTCTSCIGLYGTVSYKLDLEFVVIRVD